MNNWQEYKLGDFLHRQYDSIQIDDSKRYKRITIRTKGQGIDLRDEVEGVEIGTKNQFRAKSNQFLLSKIDAMNGAFGIVPEQCNGGIITGNFWTYNINEDIILREYLRLLCIKQVFTIFSIEASEGTTNRKYLREEKFLNLKISLPSLYKQEEIIFKIEQAKTKIDEIGTIKADLNQDSNTLLFSRYIDLIECADWLPMRRVAPIHRRQVEVKTDETYFEIGVRSFGRGLFEKPSFKGGELTWQKPFWIKEGDLLFSNIKAWEGAVGLIPKKYDSWVGSHRYITCLPNLQLIHPEFLFYYFRTYEGVNKLSLASPGSADRNRTLNTKLLQSISVPVPSLESQKKFVSILKFTEKIKEQHTQTEKEISELMPALLEKAFKGEL